MLMWRDLLLLLGMASMIQRFSRRDSVDGFANKDEFRLSHCGIS